MKEERCMLKNEDGSILVVALIMLVLLTLIGISATETSRMDIQIAGNEMVYKQNFYQADAAVMQAMQTMENSDLEASAITLGWVATTPMAISDDQIRNADYWNTHFPNDTNTVPGTATLPGTNMVKMVAVFQGIETGGSLDMGRSRIYAYRVFGRSNTKNGQVTILAGYRKPF